MDGSVNKVILLGNLGQDPDIRTMQNGKKVCTFSIATSNSWKDKYKDIKVTDVNLIRRKEFKPLLAITPGQFNVHINIVPPSPW